MRGAQPIGFIETQISWVGVIPNMQMNAKITAAQDKVLEENPGYMVWGSRMELVHDGSGVPHYNVYLGFKPIRERAPPLNPRNLNDAPPQPIGSVPVEDIIPLGAKEQKFGP